MEMIAPLRKLIEHLSEKTFLHNDQPMTCPYCGSRTIMLLDLENLCKYGELHQCPSANCRTIFIAEGDVGEE